MRFNKLQLARRARAGFSILEMAISITILTVLSGALAQSLNSVRGLTVSSNRRSTLQVQGNRALLDIVEDLRDSGYVDVAGLEYPYVFQAGQANAAYGNFNHDLPDAHGEAGDADFGLSSEIIFPIFAWAPDPVTGEMKPNVDANGTLVWDASQISYRVITRADGVNCLERLVDGANAELIAHHVERVVFDDDESSAFTIPLGSVRVRIYMRDVDGMGHVQRYFAETVVALTNE